MKLRKKKGFTIIELVIVIAVIGILTAVLVPTFINLTNKANEAADQSLVKNLNTVLATAEADVQKGYQKPNNPSDMFDILDNEGYKGETLLKNQKSGKTILYKLSTNRFEFEDGSQSGLDYWEFKKENAVTGEKKFSIYLYDDYNSNEAITVSSGLDVGTNDEANNITYLNAGAAQKAVVRTNGGGLTINAANDTVKHYGNASGINIIAVAGSSYHEFGEAGFVNISNGRIVVEEKAEIDGIFLKETAGQFNDIKIALVGQSTLPSIARSDVALNNGDSKLVVELQALATSESKDQNPQYIWISKSEDTVTSAVSSSSEAVVEVENPTPAAQVAKAETKESATPISADSVARIAATGYATLAAAIAGAKDGQTIVMLADSTSTNGYVIDKSINLDTNGKTITVTNGSNVNNRAFKITEGTFKVFGYGTIDAFGAATKDTGTDGTGCFGAFRAEVGTELELNDLTLKNYRPYGLNVKILGARALLDNVNIVSVCGGGIEVTDDDGADGTVQGYAKLTNCVMSQSNFRDWCSVPVSVSGNSTVDVYASEYTGEYGVYVFSSGGTINIYGGDFTATNEAVFKTSYDAEYGNDAIINVYGGTFVGPYSQGNQANVHEFIKIYEGTFDHDPTSYVQEGSVVTQQDGHWVVTR